MRRFFFALSSAPADSQPSQSSMNALLRGLAMGFCIAAPVGPIGLLCIRRSIVDGRWIGFATGLGAASADGVYGLVAVSGLTVVTHFLVVYQRWIQAIGGGFLVYLGLAILCTRPSAAPAVSDSKRGWWSAYSSTCLFTLSNPATVLSFIAVFAGLGVGGTAGDSRATVFLVAGVVLGSTAWWLFLSSVAGWVGGKATPTHLRGINIVSGSLVAVFGILQLVQVLR
jgi:threonine/homoserine/homoserine lactone efflux protein